MGAGWRRLPFLVLQGSPQSYRSASETAGTATGGRETRAAPGLAGDVETVKERKTMAANLGFAAGVIGGKV